MGIEGFRQRSEKGCLGGGGGGGVAVVETERWGGNILCINTTWITRLKLAVAAYTLSTQYPSRSNKDSLADTGRVYMLLPINASLSHWTQHIHAAIP